MRTGIHIDGSVWCFPGPIVELLEMKQPVEIVALAIASFARYANKQIKIT
jgi:hypothetical protein